MKEFVITACFGLLGGVIGSLGVYLFGAWSLLFWVGLILVAVLISLTQESLSTKSDRKTIALDFDGVIHSYTTPWSIPTVIPDDPVPGALNFIREAIHKYDVVIFSVRAKNRASRKAIYRWFRDHGLEKRVLDQLEITSDKPKATIYIDDRGWRFEGEFPSLELIRKLKPWNRT